MSDVATGYAALTEAQPEYVKAHGYYAGDVSEVFASPAIRRALRRSGERWKVNIAKTPVDAVADRLEILSTTVLGSEGETSPAALALQRIWDANGLLLEAPNLHHRTGEYGDAFLLVWENEDDEEPPVVNYLPPTECRVIYDRENPRKKRFAIHAWEERTPLGEATRIRANLFYPDRIEKWVTRAGSKGGDPAAWEEHYPVTNEETGETAETNVVENPYGEIPVFHFRTDGPGSYGVPLHLDGYGVQDIVNKIVISHMSAIDFTAFPQRYALTEAGNVDDDLDLDDDPDFTDEDELSVHDESVGTGMKSGPGTISYFEHVKAVGQFEPADPDAFMKPGTWYLNLFQEVTGVPFHMLDLGGDEPSGESRRRKEGKITKKAGDLAQRLSSTWSDALSFALKVAGHGEKKVDVRFAPPEVVSDAEGWATVKVKIEAGVPVRQALLETGYTPEQVDEWFPEGEENSLRVPDLLAVADILQKLGTAVTLGIITEEEARALLPEGLLPDTVPPELNNPAPVEDVE